MVLNRYYDNLDSQYVHSPAPNIITSREIYTPPDAAWLANHPNHQLVDYILVGIHYRFIPLPSTQVGISTLLGIWAAAIDDSGLLHCPKICEDLDMDWFQVISFLDVGFY